ncbi:hypothetical protein I0C86_28975 [Plantactinospora sp. S1510]|uniref:Uncharacterized protein n=1 Tax=Plantactinospora alkalitolerans TaxID=2789879 RepID=A0ABS0H3C1_9ACTN|nr:hypothetical protein [Plantactinospora alkalitolerans]MBF9132962.1 hypothetical protein [Plantactinospora alkalitolerans]
MGSRRRPRPEPDGVDRLLDAAAAGVTEPGQPPRNPSSVSRTYEQDPVAGLLAAAAAPVRPKELDGEEPAMAAFRAARHAPAEAARNASLSTARRVSPAASGDTTAPAASRLRRSRRRLTAGAGAWIAVAATTLTAGAALAADALITRPAPAPRPGPSIGTTTSDPTAPPDVPSTAVPRPGIPGPRRSGSGPAGLAPSVFGLCHAHLAGHGANQGRAAGNDPPTALVEAAGGRSEVETWCRELLATDPRPGNGTPGNGDRDTDPGPDNNPPGRDNPPGKNDPPGGNGVPGKDDPPGKEAPPGRDGPPVRGGG